MLCCVFFRFYKLTNVIGQIFIHVLLVEIIGHAYFPIMVSCDSYFSIFLLIFSQLASRSLVHQVTGYNGSIYLSRYNIIIT